MPIVAYTGLPGHGKSHSAVEHVILPALKAGRCVVTNLALHFDAVRNEYPGCDLRAFDIEAIKAAPDSVTEIVPPGAIWVIDECWKLWPAGQAADKSPLVFRSMLAEHRHRVDQAGQSMQVVLVTQDLMQIASFARQLVEQTFRTVKLSALGMSSRYRIDIYNGPAVGPNPPEKNRTSQSGGRYRKEVWKFYKTHTLSEAGGGSEGANEKTIDRRIVIWRSPVWWAVAPCVLLAFGVGVWRVWKFFHPSVVVGGPVATGRPQKHGAMRNPQTGVDQVAKAWRIVGSVIVTGQEAGQRGSVVQVSDGDSYASIDPREYCDRDAGGYWICRWRGQVITDELRPLPRSTSTAALSVFGKPLVEAQGGSTSP